MKHTTDIQALLDRYWEGETTLDEERQLREFFATEPVPEQFRREAALFQALCAERMVEMPGKPAFPRQVQRFSRVFQAAAAAAVLLLTAGAWWWLVRTAPDEVVQTDPSRTPHTEQVAPATLQAPSVETPGAVPIAVVDTKTRHIKRPVQHTTSPSKDVQPSQTLEDPEQALAEIKAALELVSSKINKGRKEINKGMKEVETLDKIIKKKSDG